MKIGNYTITQHGETWQVEGGDLGGEVIIFQKKYTAMGWVNLHHCCGDMVATGVQNILQEMINDRDSKGEN